eukprot:CAMPEP_0178900728 /NCGR_PEP_ID=MMETSP0786-20121207/3627_1 /TAXON_ID=186022 /ORGANISM="Thalassionema frauenfeldii, Strain CCMP 1798" /LENGTH=595 /DNA_ID=CAMNT_0020571749 /DNA_START=34 /DNA_END=1822 /DNA_ORIENTATION=+
MTVSNQGGTQLMPCPMDLSRGKQRTSNAGATLESSNETTSNLGYEGGGNEKEQVLAAIVAQEKFMAGEDEEIDSFDGNGNPIADTKKIENRMMTVALARSVVEATSGGGRAPTVKRGRKAGSKNKSRKRGASDGSGSSTKDSSEKPLSQTGAKPIPPPPTALVMPSPLPALSVPSSGSSTGVPNPLANVSTPLKPNTSNVPLAPPSKSTNSLGSTAVPCPLPKVQISHPYEKLLVETTAPAPAPAPAQAPAQAQAPAPAQAQAQAQAQAPVVAAPSTDLPMRRGRIFSMDIDPAGLDFPDMSVDAISNDFGESQTLPPLGSNNKSKTSAVASSQAAPVPAETAKAPAPATVLSNVSVLPSAADVQNAENSRSRAMSFEFFSLGINADEPLPPETDLEAAIDQTIQQRPRGDSMIFDPMSFQEGGIHEEKADNMMLQNAADDSNTADLPVQDAAEMAILSTPGLFATANASVAQPSLSFSQTASDAAAMKPPNMNNISTSPSSAGVLSTTVTTTTTSTSISNTHTNMDLLNKDGRIGIYLPEARRARIAKFHSKRKMRIWKKRIKYDCRKKLADSRPRIKGRFVKRTDTNVAAPIS